MGIDYKSVFKRPTVECKLIELVLGIACAAIFDTKGVALTIVKTQVVFATVYALLAINVISFLSYLCQTHLHKYINVTIALAGVCLYFASGGIMIDTYSKTGSFFDYLLSAGAVAFINGAVYIADAILSLKESGVSSN